MPEKRAPAPLLVVPAPLCDRFAGRPAACPAICKPPENHDRAAVLLVWHRRPRCIMGVMPKALRKTRARFPEFPNPPEQAGWRGKGWVTGGSPLNREDRAKSRKRCLRQAAPARRGGPTRIRRPVRRRRWAWNSRRGYNPPRCRPRRCRRCGPCARRQRSS